MFTCQYCGTQFTEHRSNCPNCGAAIQVDAKQAAKRSKSVSVLDDIRQICSQVQGLESVYFEDAIQPKRLANVMAKFEIPADEKVIFLYDDTVFNAKNDVGFAVCTRGLYWRNDWSVSTKRRHLTWDEFAKRDVNLDGLQIKLGFGDQIGVAGCGSDPVREKLTFMLKDIQRLFKSQTPA